jgi:nucleoside-diphosphate-sugar epimerase
MKKNILVTGCPGFLGNYIKNYFLNNGYNVFSLGMKEDDSSSGHLIADISAGVPLLPDVAFDIIVHAAGKAHVIPKTQEEVDSFYKVNYDGVKNIVQAIDNLTVTPRSFVFISTVAVYGIDSGIQIDESMPLCPRSPYGESKKMAEEAINTWKTNALKSIVRLPLLAGKNPPGNLGRMIKAIKKGHYANIAGGNAKRSIVLAENVASFIPILSQNAGTFNLTDGYHPSVRELSCNISANLKKRVISNLNVPLPLARLLAFGGDVVQKVMKKNFPINSLVLNKMTSDLTFSDEKARTLLGWKPDKVLENISSIIE